MLFPWLSLRATRSSSLGSGLQEDVCRRIGLVFIRVSKGKTGQVLQGVGRGG